MYSGHKRTQCHGIKFQSVVTPDGIFACMFGAICGNQPDSYMLTESGLLQALFNLMPAGNAQEGGNHDDDLYSLYGHPKYPQSAHIFGGFRNPPPGSPEALWNTLMLSVRESVERGFAHINRHWAFLNFFPGLKLFQSPIAKYYIIATFLWSLRTCFYGNQTMNFLLRKRQFHNRRIFEYSALID